MRVQPLEDWSLGYWRMVHSLDVHGPSGLHLVFGGTGSAVKAAIGPGLFATVDIQLVQEIAVGVRVPLYLERQATLAFYEERDMTASPRDELAVELAVDESWVIDVPQAITRGARA